MLTDSICLKSLMSLYIFFVLYLRQGFNLSGVDFYFKHIYYNCPGSHQIPGFSSICMSTFISVFLFKLLRIWLLGQKRNLAKQPPSPPFFFYFIYNRP